MQTLKNKNKKCCHLPVLLLWNYDSIKNFPWVFSDSYDIQFDINYLRRTHSHTNRVKIPDFRTNSLTLEKKVIWDWMKKLTQICTKNYDFFFLIPYKTDVFFVQFVLRPVFEVLDTIQISISKHKNTEFETDIQNLSHKMYCLRCCHIIGLGISLRMETFHI